MSNSNIRPACWRPVLLILALLASVPVLIAGAAGDTMQNAGISVNYDETIKIHIDPYNWSLGPTVRFAPEGRDEAYRPAPGVIEETRSVIELPLNEVRAGYPYGVGSATLKLNVWQFQNISAVRLLVRGYTADGVISEETAGPDYGPPLNPTAFQALGTVTVAETGPVTIDVTAFINQLLKSGAAWAGVNLQVDYTSLPPRGSLPEDTTFGVDIYSSQSPNGPEFAVTGPTSTQLVNAMENDIFALVNNGTLQPAQAAPLILNLAPAAYALDHGRPAAARQLLMLYTFQVRAYMRASILSPAVGQNLLDRGNLAIQLIR